MAKRDKSEAAQHDTFPGTGPLRAPSRENKQARPVEEAVDSAIERRARQTDRLRANERGKRLVESLSWRGIEVSEEFRRYAERIASGENLPPYRGEVLAKPDPEFPWRPSPRAGGVPPQRRRSGRALLYVLSASSVLVAALIVWAAALRIGDRRAGGVPAEVTRGRAALQPTEPRAPAPAEASPPVDVKTGPAVQEEPNAALPITDTQAEGSLLDEAGVSRPRPAPPVAPAGRVSSAPAPAVPRTSSASPANTSALRRALNELLTPAVQTPAPALKRPAPSADPAVGGSESAPAAAAALPAAGAAEKSPAASPALPASSAAPDAVVARKEPEAETAVQGSLLVETPSF